MNHQCFLSPLTLEQTAIGSCLEMKKSFWFDSSDSNHQEQSNAYKLSNVSPQNSLLLLPSRFVKRSDCKGTENLREIERECVYVCECGEKQNTIRKREKEMTALALRERKLWSFKFIAGTISLFHILFLSLSLFNKSLLFYIAIFLDFTLSFSQFFISNQIMSSCWTKKKKNQIMSSRWTRFVQPIRLLTNSNCFTSCFRKTYVVQVLLYVTFCPKIKYIIYSTIYFHNSCLI